MSRLLRPEVSSAATWTSREAGGSAAAQLLVTPSRSGSRKLVGASQHLRQWEFMGLTSHISLQRGSIPACSTWRKKAGLGCVASVEGDGGVRRARAPASSNAARAVSARDAAGPLPFARVAESTQEAPPAPPSSSQSGGYPGSPLLWIGVGVGVTILFASLTGWTKNRVQRMALEQMMQAMSSSPGGVAGANPFAGMPFPPPPAGGAGANPFAGIPFPPPSAGGQEPSGSSFSRPGASAASSATIDTTATNAPLRGDESSSAAEPEFSQSQPKKRSSAFTDIGVEEQQQAAYAGSNTQVIDPPPHTTNGQAAPPGGLTMEMLEKMLSEPTIQKMLMQYLPENVRDPETLKWVLQNPIYRTQLEDALQNMNQGGGAWDPRVMETFSKLDLNSDEMKKQFEQVGMTPEQMVSTVMSDPKMAEALQNPKFQAAILDCAQNPMNMLKYQNDPEIMMVFDKMQKLFPNMGA